MTRSFMIVEIRGAGIEYAYQTGFPTESLAQESADGSQHDHMEWRTIK